MEINKKKTGSVVAFVLFFIVVPIAVYMIPVKIYSERFPFEVTIYDRSKTQKSRMLLNLSKYPTKNDPAFLRSNPVISG